MVRRRSDESTLTEKAKAIVTAFDKGLVDGDGVRTPKRSVGATAMAKALNWSRQRLTDVLSKGTSILRAFLACKAPSSTHRFRSLAGTKPLDLDKKTSLVRELRAERDHGTFVSPHSVRARLASALERPVGLPEFGRFLLRFGLVVRTTSRQLTMSVVEATKYFAGHIAALRILIPRESTPPRTIYTADESPGALRGEQIRQNFPCLTTATALH